MLKKQKELKVFNLCGTYTIQHGNYVLLKFMVCINQGWIRQAETPWIVWRKEFIKGLDLCNSFRAYWGAAYLCSSLSGASTGTIWQLSTKVIWRHHHTRQVLDASVSGDLSQESWGVDMWPRSGQQNVNGSDMYRLQAWPIKTSHAWSFLFSIYSWMEKTSWT